MKNLFIVICIILPLNVFCQLFFIESEDTLDYKYYPQRINELNLLIALDSNQIEYYFKRSTMNFKLKNYQKCIEDNQLIIKKFGDHQSAYCNLGMTYCYINDSTNAVTSLKKAIFLAPGEAVNYLNLGFIQLYFNDYLGAIPNLKQALLLKNNYTKAYYYLGYASMKLGESAEARSYYLKAIELIPYYAEAIYNLGFLAFQEENYKEAIVYFTNALNFIHFKDHKVKLFEMRGKCYEKLGETANATADFQRASSLK